MSNVARITRDQENQAKTKILGFQVFCWFQFPVVSRGYRTWGGMEVHVYSGNIPRVYGIILILFWLFEMHFVFCCNNYEERKGNENEI